MVYVSLVPPATEIAMEFTFALNERPFWVMANLTPLEQVVLVPLIVGLMTNWAVRLFEDGL